MSKITAPMLAKDSKIIFFPVLATPKIDGIRALIINGKLVSRTFKPINNKKMAELLEKILPEGADGEITCGETFQSSTSAVMKKLGTESFDIPFTFHMFDLISDELGEPYSSRMEKLRNYIPPFSSDLVTICKLLPVPLSCKNDLDDFEAECLNQGYEGVMLRKPDGKYKCGRSTEKEGLLVKVKQFCDAEATIVGYTEMQHNNNIQTKNDLGFSVRSSNKDKKSDAGCLGAFLVKSDLFDETFEIGTGFDLSDRHTFWRDKETLLNKVVKFKYFPQGVKDRPRHPVFLGFRDPSDI